MNDLVNSSLSVQIVKDKTSRNQDEWSVSKSDIAGKDYHVSYRLDRLMAFSGGNSENYQEIIMSFIRSCSQNVKLFRQSLQERNKEAISELSHKMLTLFRYLEASEIVELLALLSRKKSDLMESNYYYVLGESVLEMIETLLQTIRQNAPVKNFAP